MNGSKSTWSSQGEINGLYYRSSSAPPPVDDRSSFFTSSSEDLTFANPFMTHDTASNPSLYPSLPREHPPGFEDFLADSATKKQTKVRWNEPPSDRSSQGAQQHPREALTNAFPGLMAPKTSKSLPGSRRNSLSKDDLGQGENPHEGQPSLLSQMFVSGPRQPPPFAAPMHHSAPNINFGGPQPYQGPNPFQGPFSHLPPQGGQFHPPHHHHHHQFSGAAHPKIPRHMSAHGPRSDGLSSMSPVIPPQFSDHFLLDDDDLVGSPAAPSYVKKYLHTITNDSTHFPVLLRRDSLPGMLSASSAALDLAPLPQTRRSDPFHSSPLKKDSHVADDAGAPHKPSEPKEMRRAFSEDVLPQHPNGFHALSPEGGDPWESSELARGGAGVCKYYRQGYCSRGDRCKFSHVTSSSPAVDPAPFDAQAQASPGLSSASAASASAAAAAMTSATIPSGLTSSPTAGTLNGSPKLALGISPPGHAGLSPPVSAGDGALFPLSPSSSSSSIGYPSPQFQPNNSPPLDGPLLKNIKNMGSPSKKGHKRSTSAPEAPRFPPLEQLVGQIYSLCRDQHGCRYLQKKLEEGKEEYVEIIANEIGDHLLELMSDPFGNYLCQKLFIYATEAQRTQIALKVMDGLVDVSLNMHGTRSVQKLIDCMTTPEQISLITKALKGSVVKLIKDLNGNHVIQKCLNKLAPEQNQFIYDAVTEHCVEVASHRHGCCVLQRCIDHASPYQKAQLAREITASALPLVQDAFGNYVVQYILDLNVPEYSNPLISRFFDHVFPLSLQKFSSNVIEKCIRVAQPEIRRGLIAGVIEREKVSVMLQDAFANYVIQTSLDVADPDQHHMLVELVRPLLPSIRHLPYCKRVQSKLNRDVPPMRPQSIHFPLSPYPQPLLPPPNLH